MMWRHLCALALLGRAVARPSLNFEQHAGNDSMSFARFMPRQSDDDFDPADLSFIKNLAAIGDSYSAGIGAGDKLGSIIDALESQSDWACSRYDNSYPYLVYNDPRFGDSLPNFQFLSCSGALTADVLEHQIPSLNNDQDAIMLSIGGNDAQLTNILNQCVFQWATFNWEQVDVAEIVTKFDKNYAWAEGYDFEALGRGCAGQLAISADLINGGAFSSSLDNVLSAAKLRLASGGKIYWTGYAKFFAEDLSSDCDTVTWTTWVYKLINVFQPTQYLTSDMRKTMNSLVDQVNSQLAAAADRAGDSVVFVNYDQYVGNFNGRFCEAGVDESTKESNTRVPLMFYELDSLDLFGSSPWKRTNDDPLNGTFQGDTNVFAQIVEVADPDAVFTQQDLIGDADASTQSALEVNPTKSDAVEDDDDSNIQVPNLLPDGYGRVFHPQILLHQVIANLVLWEMSNVNEVNHGLPALPESLSPDGSCPIGDVPVPDFYARVLPLGASIMQGYKSTDGNGMRKHLRDTLRQLKWDVNMVGSKNTGDMVDNNNEATVGDRVDQIQQKFKSSSKYQPNIVLLNAGTNDATQDFDLANFGNRYDSLLDDIYAAIPGVTVVASTILPGNSNGIPQNRDSMNDQIRNLVANRRYNQAERLVLTDVDIPSGFFTTTDIGPDGTHPTDDGYVKLASFFLRGIEQADSEGMFTEPQETPYSDEPGASGGGNNTCDKVYGSGNSGGPVTTQQGSGIDDGIYVHNSDEKGVVWSISTSGSTLNVTFARLSEAYGNDDLVIIDNFVSSSATKGRQYRVWINNGEGWPLGTQNQGTDYQAFLMPDTCIARGVRFADVNADGLDDMICIAVDGTAYASINQGSFSFSASAKWMDTQGPAQDRVLLADVDGDGRVDYCAIADNGDIHCWRNGGQGDYPEYWQDLGTVFTGKGLGDLNGVRFFDLNGDARDDWMWVDDTGKTTTYTNNRACTKGTLEPLWRQGTNANDQSTYTHPGMGSEVGRDNIFFAKVYGKPESFGLGGRADYIWKESTPGSAGLTNHNFHVWQNEGSGATKLKADGDRYCNMKGRANGAMDYIWVHSTGYMILYESLGGKFPSESPYWGSNYQIWAATDQFGTEIDRRDLHLADWDGDGLCDIIYVDPNGGLTQVWVNQFKANGNFDTWDHFQVTGLSCNETRGVGIFDLAVRFADIDGDKRADYLCIEKNTRTTGFLNQKDGLKDIGQIKYSIDKDRANLRWADVNGDGLLDMLWVDKFVGDASVWYNGGMIPASGSSFTWVEQGPLYEGAAQGPCISYPDLDGDGRADMSVVDSLTNTAKTWFNTCPGGGQGDNGDDPDTFTSEIVSLP